MMMTVREVAQTLDVVFFCYTHSFKRDKNKVMKTPEGVKYQVLYNIFSIFVDKSDAMMAFLSFV